MQHEKYIRIGTVDKELLSDLLEKAKGPGRNMKQFALDCDVNPSTFSRIANKLNNGASKEDLIRKIAENADPNSGVTLETLMNANGMVLNEKDGIRISPYSSIRMFEDNIAGIVTNEILNQGASIYEKIERRYHLNKKLRYKVDMVLKTNGVESGNQIWAFEFMNTYMFIPTVGSVESARRGLNPEFTRRMMDYISRILTLYCGGDDDLPEKFSIVVALDEGFDELVEIYSSLKVYDNISIIGCNIEKGYIIDEYVLNRKDGKTMDKFFKEHDDILNDVDDEDIDYLWKEYEGNGGKCV